MATTMDAGPFGWFQISLLRRLILTRGLVVLGLAVGLSLLLTLLALLALGVGVAHTFSAFTGGSFTTSSAQGPSSGHLVGAFLVILGFFFFTAHLAPFNADVSLFGSSIYGVGSLLITTAVLVLAYRSGGWIERRFPYSISNGESALRAAFIAVPYWIGCLLLFLLSRIHAQSAPPYGAAASLGPSALGLLTPLLLVCGAAALGARRQRGRPLSNTSSSAARGAVLALFAIAVGMLASLVGAILAGLIGLATHSSAFSSSPSSPSSPSPTVSPSALGPVFALLVLVVAIFYIPNGLFWLWGSALGLDLSSFGWLILIFGVLGALVGSLTVQARPDRTEQVSFALTFSIASFILAFISRPSIAAYALGGNPWIVLIVGLVLGMVLAVAGPYAARTGLGQSTLALPLMAAVLRRLPLAGEAGVDVGPSLAFSASETRTSTPWLPGMQGPGWSPPPSGPATAVTAPVKAAPAQPRLPFGMKARIVGTAVAIAALCLTACGTETEPTQGNPQKENASSSPAHWTTTTIDPTDGGGADISVTLHRGSPHVFSRGDQGELRHCWWSGTAWKCEVLDSNRGTGDVSSFEWGNQLHAFYAVTVNDNIESGVHIQWLRHMWFDRTWHSEDFVIGGIGSVGDSVAAVLYMGNPHVFYSDCDSFAFCGITHEWWDGQAWRSEPWDNHIGNAISLLPNGNTLNVFYSAAAGQLAHGWFTPGLGWQLEYIDGPSGIASGAVNCPRFCVADDGTAATVYQGQFQVFELGRDSGLRHCSGSAGNWKCEDLDADAGSSDTQGNSRSIGLSSADYAGLLHVFYKANSDLRHMWSDGQSWHDAEVLDRGSWLNQSGDYSSTLIWQNQLQIFYRGGHNVRQTYWIPAQGPARAAPVPTPQRASIPSAAPTPTQTSTVTLPSPSATPPLSATPSPSATVPMASPTATASPGQALPAAYVGTMIVTISRKLLSQGWLKATTFRKL